MKLERIHFWNYEVEVQKPSTCLNCGVAVNAEFINVVPYEYREGYIHILAVFQCPECNKGMFVLYITHENSLKYQTDDNVESLTPIRIFSIDSIPLNIPKEICDISEKFKKIYSEAYSAEQNGLDYVAGIGYRMSFEFLIKDYAIHKETEQQNIDEIKKMKLSDCINKYFPNEKTKELLLATAWIGNDFAHYQNYHEDFKLVDLKELIRLSVNDIRSEILRGSYVKKIKPKK